MTAKIFISHFSEDAVIAEAIERLVTALSREIDVRCSSSRTMGANVPPGTQWINWIVNEATSSDV
ncbi:MAG TPA: hypothetical protein VJR89_18780, partial [Polyangiales bacterium]|nr:hypothetical protein [Polyangiales bacterium]